MAKRHNFSQSTIYIHKSLWTDMMIATLTEFTKRGFARLIKPFESSTDDLIKITRAFGIALKAHGRDFRDENHLEPYINHPLKVALVITEELHIFNADLVCAALLHDTTLNDDGELRQDFGEVIHDIVHLVAMPKIMNEEREKALQEYFYNIINSSVLARYLILADRLEITRALKNAPHKNKILRYKEETQKYIIPIAEKTDENIVFKLSIALYELK
jgi:(p)ppGpp synthase/HD superfamily hydrolase